MRVGSLFSGIGGIDLGLERAGFEIAWQCENDEYCRKVLAKHWPSIPIFEDITTLTDPPPVDMLAGGFPCQDVSVAGRREGLKKGNRSGLWFEFARLIRELRPRYVLLENVPGLLVRGMDRVLGDLSEIGYDAWWTTLSAADVGAPHLRKRIWIVAYPGRSRDERGCCERERQVGTGPCSLPVGSGEYPRQMAHTDSERGRRECGFTGSERARTWHEPPGSGESLAPPDPEEPMAHSQGQCGSLRPASGERSGGSAGSGPSSHLPDPDSHGRDVEGDDEERAEGSQVGGSVSPGEQRPDRARRLAPVAHASRRGCDGKPLKQGEGPTGRRGAVERGEEVAHAHGRGLEEQGLPVRPGKQGEASGFVGGAGETIPDSDRQSLAVGSEPENRRGAVWDEGEAATASGWWATEPDVCGMVDGISQGLDGPWIGTPTASMLARSERFGVGRLPNPQEIADASEGMDTTARAPEAPKAPLRTLWEHVAHRAASQGRGSDEQLIRELADAMPDLPYQRALANREEAMAEASSFLHRLHKASEEIGVVRDPSESLVAAWLAASEEDQDWIYLAACRGQWVGEWPNVGRVATGVPSRVDRLKSLGNSVVPMCAQVIGEMILENARTSRSQ